MENFLLKVCLQFIMMINIQNRKNILKIKIVYIVNIISKEKILLIILIN